QVAEVGRALAPRARALGPELGEVAAGDHRLHAVEREGVFHVDRADPRVRVRAAQHLAPEHPGQGEVRAELRAAGHLVESVVADRPGSDLAELALAHRVAPRSSAAVSSTARMILS